jgi:hypothetical protein
MVVRLMADWHWWCDPCDVAEAGLAKGDAIARAFRHDRDEHEGERTAHRAAWVPPVPANGGQS